MKLTVEQVTTETPEEVLIRCHDPEEPWVSEVQNIAAGQITVNGVLDGKMCRLKLGDIYYFEVVEGSSFLYCQKEVFSCKQKLYEFEALCIGTMLFRCSKSMILNAGKIDSILPSLSGRFEAVLDNGEKVMISRQLTGGVEQQAHEKGAEHDKAVDKHKPMQPEFDFFHTLLLIAPAAVSGH